jgi:CRISPR-associated protein Csx3
MSRIWNGPLPGYEMLETVLVVVLLIAGCPMIKLILCGPPHSGKSCFKNGLIGALKGKSESPYPYQINACPDGEGSWFHATAQMDPELAARERRKGEFSEAQVDVYRTWVDQVKEPLTIVDVGGLMSPENRIIMAGGTHAVILSRDIELFEPWIEFCEALQLPVIARIYSDYDAIEDQITFQSGLLTGMVHHLDRKIDASTRPMVQALADHVLTILQTLGNEGGVE